VCELASSNWYLCAKIFVLRNLYSCSV